MKAYVTWLWAGVVFGLGWVWARLTWENVLAVVNPRFDRRTAKVVGWGLLWAAIVAVAAALVAAAGMQAWAHPRAAAEVVGVLVLLRTIRWGRKAQAAAAVTQRECREGLDLAEQDLNDATGEIIRLRADFANRLALEVAAQVQTLTAERLLLGTERDEAVEARADAEAKLQEATQRLDLSGQFFAVCLRWTLARRSKKAAPTVAGKKLDADYWWKEVERVAALRWPGRTWQPDELAGAAQEVGESPDLAKWRRVVNSAFGLTLTV